MSTLRIDSSSIRKMLITQGHLIVMYHLPKAAVADGENPQAGYARLQNWLKENVAFTYYYQQWGRKLYCLLGRGEIAPTYAYERTELVPLVLDAQTIVWENQEPFLNLILAAYLKSQEKFVSNERFFIYVEPIQRNQYAVAMSLQIRRNRSAFHTGRDKFHFAIVSRVMRFRKVTVEEYESKWKWKKVPYALDFSEGSALRLRQLRPGEAQSHRGDLHVLKSNRKNKASVRFLDVNNKADFLKSRVGLMGQFIQEFVVYLNQCGLEAKQERLEYQRVELPANRLQQLMPGFQFQILDCRECRDTPLEAIISQSPLKSLRAEAIHTNVTTLASGLPVLLWMDASKAYYKSVSKGSGHASADPYIRFKTQYPAIASQGFDFNGKSHAEGIENYFEYHPEWNANRERKLEISLRQLLLKQVIQHPEAVVTQGLLPASLSKKVFLSYCSAKEKDKMGRFITFAMEDEHPRVREFTSCLELRSYISHVTGNDGTTRIWEKLCPSDSGRSSSEIESGAALEPFLKMFRRLKAVVFDERGYLKIEQPSEYALYDYGGIMERFAKRGEIHPVQDLLPLGQSEIHQKLEDFFEEMVTERQISYDQLKAKYSKGERGFLHQVFGPKSKETAYLNLLKQSNGLVIPGLKEKPIYEIASGVWYNETERKYFVGRSGGLKNYDQPYGFPIRWIDVCEGFRFDESAFFDWFDREFIREKEMTVLPLPFTLIRMKQEMAS